MANLALAINKRLMKILKTNRKRVMYSKSERELKRIAIMMYTIRDVLDSYSRDFEELSRDADDSRAEVQAEKSDGPLPKTKASRRFHTRKRRKKK